MTDKKERSSAYPSHSINHCIPFSTKLYKSFGKSNFIDLGNLEAVTGKKYSTIKRELSSCTQYGFLDRKSKAGFKPTDLIEKLTLPDNPSDQKEKRRLLIEAFKKPAVNQFIITRYEGQILPVRAGLRNILIRDYGIAENVIDNALDVLYDNINSLGLLNGNNTFSLDSDTPKADKDDGENGNNKKSNNPKIGDKVKMVNAEGQYLNNEPLPITAISEDGKFIQVASLGNSYLSIDWISELHQAEKSKEIVQKPPIVPPATLPNSGATPLGIVNNIIEKNKDNTEYRTLEIMISEGKKIVMAVPVNVTKKDTAIVRHHLDGIDMAIE